MEARLILLSFYLLKRSPCYMFRVKGIYKINHKAVKRENYLFLFCFVLF